ncbi:exodeoxyribonuclease VII large subunit [Paludisphaera borealis]|uniref:Exodeoxyribonuclease 7 large subunit n=1 Tax=Paludisphaera borealis TaxID=1387353 RepID=A0A1U7CT97_9BACT|nr:exodeoxyribonuclease VII large subunit [Paludisphaera borealis]APW62103.1 Exodeoxyribonuclease 7 large subunit [Paludisphaera borealis]
MASSSGFEFFQSPYNSVFESVGELTERIKATLESDFGQTAVRGEISNLARPRSGHIYFSLKDNAACIRAVMWKGAAQRLVFDLSDGLAVRLLGRLTVYSPRGEYQIIVDAIEPEGVGAQELAFRQLVARLSAEGLFDPDRKRPLPRYPRRIAIVTSPTGAAVRDLLQVTGRRWNGTDVLIVPTLVQGVGAGKQIAAAIELAGLAPGVEVVIVARGGGSSEDLGAFNDEAVVRAIAGSRVPVVSAVGHEIDVTLADLAADRRALTPSEAGELVVPDAAEVAMHLDRLAQALHRASEVRLRDARARLDRLSQGIKTAIGHDLDGRRHRLDRLKASLEALNPLAVLARGYSLTLAEDGRTLVRDPSQAPAGTLIHTQLASGRLTSRVEAS